MLFDLYLAAQSHNSLPLSRTILRFTGRPIQIKSLVRGKLKILLFSVVVSSIKFSRFSEIGREMLRLVVSKFISLKLTMRTLPSFVSCGSIDNFLLSPSYLEKESLFASVDKKW